MFGRFKREVGMRLQRSFSVAQNVTTHLENIPKAMFFLPDLQVGSRAIRWTASWVCLKDQVVLLVISRPTQWIVMKKNKPLTKKERDDKRKKHKEKKVAKKA